MLQKLTLLSLLFISTLLAGESISIEALLKTNYADETINIEKKSLILTKEEASTIQTKAYAKVRSKIVRYYEIKKDENLLGHAVLLRQKIRTKNAAILYMVDANRTMIGLEIISFKEPSEYKPNKEWQSIFVGKTSEDTLMAGKDIATISGATLSARAITDSARIALAIVTEKL
jgi:hypothetical protein